MKPDDAKQYYKQEMPLFRYFVVVSILALAVILLITGIGLRSVLHSYVTAGAEHDAIHLADALSELESSKLIHPGPGGREIMAVDPSAMSLLDHDMRGFLSHFNVIKIKVFDRKTRIIYSTDHKIIGTIDRDNEKLRAALAGEVRSKLEAKDHVWDLAVEYRPDVDVVETYVPVWGSDGSVIGSFEIYKNVTDNLHDSRDILVRSITLLFFVLVVVESALCAMMYAASRSSSRYLTDLRASETRTRTIIEQAADAIVTVNEQGVVESFNRAAQVMFGLTDQTILGRRFTELLGTNEGEMTDSEFARFCESLKADVKKGEGVESTGLRRTGALFPIHLTATKVSIAGDVLCTVIIRDLTEQKREELRMREDDLKRADQMEMIAQLATGVAHELRNPLTVVKLFFQNNKEEALSLGMSVDDLDVVEHEISRMERTLNVFLDFARPNKPRFRKFEIKPVIDRTLILIEGQAAEQQVACLKFFECPADLQVHGDPDQIQQLLLNLCMNALDVMPDGGTLEVHTSIQDVGRIQVKMMDTGPGISESVMSRIFEPFVTTKRAGTGLGLVISKRITESHGGMLTFHNRSGGGACFVMNLPIDDQRTDQNDGV